VLDRDIHQVVVDQQRQAPRRRRESFDRIAFAMRALQILKPDMRVVVYHRIGSLQVESGPDLVRGNGTRYAMIGIPPHATREHIAYRLADLTGAAQTPYMLALLTRAPTPPEA
jgi:hypothetical protein